MLRNYSVPTGFVIEPKDFEMIEVFYPPDKKTQKNLIKKIIEAKKAKKMQAEYLQMP